MEQIKNFEKLQTPCFIMEYAELEKSMRGFQHALAKNFNRSVVGYSVKTNSLPKCVQMIGQMGAYAEVVSCDEYELALLCGYSRDKIIYNGPMKSKETFLDAVENGAIVNIETKRELEWLNSLPIDKLFKVGLRLNVNISHLSSEDAIGEDDNSRFGFSDETSEFADAVRTIEAMKNIRLFGLHIHRTSHSRSIRFYKALIEFACRTIKKYGLRLDYMDVGGGYFGIFPNKPTYQEYSDVFYEVLSCHGLQDLNVIVEPGNALVASCFSFLTEVLDVKHVEDGLWFVTTDGSRNDVDPFFKKNNYLYEVHYKSENSVVNRQIIGGCTCLEYDRLFELENKPLLSVGDRIHFRNVGAYTMCLSPMFIRYIPCVYIRRDERFELIRKKWTANEYMLKDII